MYGKKKGKAKLPKRGERTTNHRKNAGRVKSMMSKKKKEM